MKEGRIILKAKLTNISPLTIGSGRSELTDRDLVTTCYPIDSENRILPPDKIGAAKKYADYPFIPASSFMGKLYRLINPDKDKILEKYWGESEKNASLIDCSDVLLTELPVGNVKEIRDGIRLNSATGIVAKGAKFDYELLAPGAKFSLTMIMRVGTFIEVKDGSRKEYNFSKEFTKQLAGKISYLIRNGIVLGGKSTAGFGLVKGEANVYLLDFDNPEHFEHWIYNRLDKGDPLFDETPVEAVGEFIMEASFRIKNSLIIRSYSTDPALPDSAHLKSGGKNILSGTSLKGALRNRAERILNTIQNDPAVTEVLISGLFGDVEKDPKDREKVKKDGYTVPSRVFVSESVIENVKEEIQTRIQIDRFTGGTIDGALIEEVPLFPLKDTAQVEKLQIRVADAMPADKGLMLLLLKDLWTADLPVGGEKSIGRGVLEGISATVIDGNTKYQFPQVFESGDEMKVLQTYVDALNRLEGKEDYIKRVDKYKKATK